MAFVKELYMAKSIEELEEYAVVKKGKANKDKILPLLVKLFTAAEETFLNGDEEKAYVYYTRFFTYLEKIEKHAEYDEQRETVLQTIGGEDSLKKAKQSVNNIREILNQRYSLQNPIAPKTQVFDVEPIKKIDESQSLFNYSSIYKQLVEKVLLKTLEDIFQNQDALNEENQNKSNETQQLLVKIAELEQEKKLLSEKLRCYEKCFESEANETVSHPETEQDLTKNKWDGVQQKLTKLSKGELKKCLLLKEILQCEEMVLHAFKDVEKKGKILHDECKLICQNVEQFMGQTCSAIHQLQDCFTLLKYEFDVIEPKAGPKVKKMKH